jgi:hypothetical protein
MKIYTQRPPHWIDNEEEAENQGSLISEYQSGKVQKNITNDKSIEQENLFAEDGKGKRQILKSSDKVCEDSQGKLVITEEANQTFKQRANSSNTSFTSVESHKENIASHTDDISANAITTYYKANKTSISFNIVATKSNEVNSISSSKRLKITSPKASISASQANFEGISTKINAETINSKAPQHNINAGSVKYDFQDMKVDADTYEGNFKKQAYL